MYSSSSWPDLGEVVVRGPERAVDHRLRRAVLEPAGLRVLEPEQAGVEHGDAVVLALHDVLGCGERLRVRSQMRLHARAG